MPRDRQTDIQTDRQADRQTERQAQCTLLDKGMWGMGADAELTNENTR